MASQGKTRVTQSAPGASTARRARVALACERCKSRKQKCDGKHPACTKCERLGIRCEYVVPSKPMPFGRAHYVTALEGRIGELEDVLTSHGLLDQVAAFTPYKVPGLQGLDHASRPPTETAIESAPRTRAVSLSGSESRTSDIDQDDSMVRILRDLSLESNGGYIGATSHFTIGRLVSSIVQVKQHALRDNHSLSGAIDTSGDRESPEALLADVPPDVASRLFCGYIKHAATRYPAVQSTWLYELHCRRDRITDAYERSTLHLVYAIAGRFLETTGESNSRFVPERHHAEVLKDLDVVLQYHDTRSIVTLLLLAIYSLRAEGGPGAWTYIGLAMRIAIDLGLHRQTSSMNKFGFDVEMRKRLFWSCYTMDRQISIPLGRPFSISDSDIDVALPLDIDESCQDIRVLEHASKLDSNRQRSESTSLTAFLHILRLRRIESSIQRTIYRVDQPTDATNVDVDRYLEELEAWKNTVPLDAKRQVDRDSVAFDGYDYYMVFYYKCHRLLLYPLISRPRPDCRYLKACAQVCGGVAQTYKRLHQALSVGYSLMALQTVFMAGLTLVYCAWLSPDEVLSSTVSNDINACCIVLYVITERWPAAKKYRDAFESVKAAVIDPLSSGQSHTARKVVAELPMMDLPLDGDHREYDSMVTHMSGRQTESLVSPMEPVAIGTEQVQYQMGTSTGNRNAQDFIGAPAQREHAGRGAAFVAPGGHGDESNDLRSTSTYHDMGGWANMGMGDEFGFTADTEPFDLEGYSVDMGWIADSFGPSAR